MAAEDKLIELEKTLEGMDRGFFRAKVEFSLKSQPVRIPEGPVFISAAVHPSSGTGRVEFTLSSPTDVEAGSAKWIAWSFGDVAQSKAESLIVAITAVRGIASGDAVLEICAR